MNGAISVSFSVLVGSNAPLRCFFGSELHYNAVCCICSNEYGMTNIQQNQARESHLDMKLYHDISINVVFLGGGRFFPCYNLYIV